jgi:hypothetical protein
MREEIIQKLVNEFGEKASSFNNTETNKQREKFWTYNRLLNYYRKLVDKRDEALVEQFELEDFDKRDIGF